MMQKDSFKYVNCSLKLILLTEISLMKNLMYKTIVFRYFYTIYTMYSIIVVWYFYGFVYFIASLCSLTFDIKSRKIHAYEIKLIF